VKILRNRAVAALLAAEIVSSLGTQMTWIALPWFVLRTTGSPQRMTWVLVAELVPIALFGLVGGAVAARIGTRRTMLVADFARAPLMAAIPALHALGLLPFGALLALVAATGVFIAPYFAVQRSVIPDVVGENETTIAQVTAITQAANRLTIFLGPPAAGVLIGVIGTAQILYVDAATYLVSFALVALFVHVAPTTVPADEPEARHVLAGVRFLARDRLLRIWWPSFTLIDIAWTTLFASLPVLVVHHYDANPRILGLLFGALGAGALVGAVAAYRLVARFDGLTLCSLAFACQITSIWLVALPAPWEVPLAGFFSAGFFMTIVNSPAQALLTLRIPRHLRPQVMTAFGTTMSLGAPVALVGAGAALTHVESRVVIVVVLAVQTAAVALFIGAAIAERSALRAAPAVDSAA
jgi:MFS family permease